MRFGLFGKEIEIILYDVDKSIENNLIFEIEEYALKLQKIFNFYDPNSELSTLNKKREMKVSKELLGLITRAKYYHNLSKDFDISLGKKIEKQKIGKNIEINCSYNDIHISNTKIKLTNPDILIDLGSIAKGYIADKIIEFIQELGIEGAFINARGDLKIFGEHSEIINIKHPRNKGHLRHEIILKNNAIATSGDYKQYIDSYNNCHIIGKKSFCSVTIVANSLEIADGLATAIFLMNIEDAKNHIKKENISAILIDNELNEYIFNMDELLLNK